ncbi:MAG: VanZ family protein [Anderseniella sp.]
MQVFEITRWLWRPGYFAMAIAIFIATGSLMPAEDAQLLPGSDFSHHAIAYGVLSFFALLAATGKLKPGIVLLGVLVFGATLECIQPFFGRVFDSSDVIANAVGIVVGLGAAIGLRGVVQRLIPRQWLYGLD